jgi:hypothetical protein
VKFARDLAACSRRKWHWDEIGTKMEKRSERIERLRSVKEVRHKLAHTYKSSRGAVGGWFSVSYAKEMAGVFLGAILGANLWVVPLLFFEWGTPTDFPLGLAMMPII